MITTCGVTITTIASSKVADVHCCVHGIYVCKITRTSLDGSLSVVIDIDSGIHILVVTITLNRHAVLMLDWVACSTVLSLLTKFSLSDCLNM